MPPVLLLTSTNLTCNPRCHKELRLLLEQGYQVTLMAFRLHNWSEPVEAELRRQYPLVTFIDLETTRHGNFGVWLKASLLEKAARLTARWFPRWWWLQSLAVSKRSWILYQAVKQYAERPSLVIAHNPPAFYAAWRISKKMGIPFALDIEDYHPGEDNPPAERRSITRLMKKLLPLTAYNSYAAPLIRDYSLKLAGSSVSGEQILVPNSFSRSTFRCSETPQPEHPAVELVWFSQVVDFRRGLEWILPALDRFPEGAFHLTLIGDMRADFFQQELKNRKYITCIPAMPQEDLLQRISAFDAGFALERNDADFNRNICLTNKIWTYFQAGLFILATPTEAQLQFLEQFPLHGRVAGTGADAGYQLLCDVRDHIADIRRGKPQRFEAARAHAWETACQPLLRCWQQLTA